MTQQTIQIQIPFESLINAIASLELEEKRRLVQILEKEITQAEEKQIIQNQNGRNIFYETSGEILTIEEIVGRYPNQWVLIGEPELNYELSIIRGQVLAYSPDEYEIYNVLSLFDIKSKAIEYTGSIPEDLAVLM